MSKGLDMLRDYIEHDALCVRRRKCCDFEYELQQEFSALKSENAKLRELVRDAWGDGHPDRSCGDCDIRDECHNDTERLRKDGMLRFSRCLFELRIEDRMRELGFEVLDERA